MERQHPCWNAMNAQVFIITYLEPFRTKTIFKTALRYSFASPTHCSTGVKASFF